MQDIALFFENYCKFEQRLNLRAFGELWSVNRMSLFHFACPVYFGADEFMNILHNEILQYFVHQEYPVHSHPIAGYSMEAIDSNHFVVFSLLLLCLTKPKYRPLFPIQVTRFELESMVKFGESMSCCPISVFGDYMVALDTLISNFVIKCQ